MFSLPCLYAHRRCVLHGCVLFRFMSILLSLQRLGPNCEVEAADSHARLLLTSVVGAFKTLLRTSESSGSVSERDKITYEKIGGSFSWMCSNA